MTPLACPLSEPAKLRSTYKNYLSGEVEEGILQFHNRTKYTFPENVQSTFFNHVPHNVLLRSERLETFLLPVYKNSVEIPKAPELPLRRERSAYFFTDKEKVNKVEFFSILQNTFLTFRISDDEEMHRPYASAGALYPIETVTAISLQLSDGDLPAACYHILPESGKLGQLPPPPGQSYNSNVFINPEFGHAAFAFIYCINLPKAVFKYQYRGYRHAMMEVGCLAHQADLASRFVGLSSRSWSGFCDDLISSQLGFNKRELLPVLIQCFGKEVPHDSV